MWLFLRRNPPSRMPSIARLINGLANSSILAAIILLQLFSSLNDHSAASAAQVFVDNQNTGGVFQHLVTDRRTGRLYIGATNRLYQLSADLNLETLVRTGPRDDNPFCPPPTSADCHDGERTPTDAVNKALAIDHRGDRLLACSNLYQGHCERRLLSNVSVADTPVWAMVVPNDVDSPAVVVVAPGPPNPASTDVVYVASTRSTVGQPAYRDIVPAVCARSRLDLGLVSDDILTPSRVDVEIQHRDSFRVAYVAGFSTGGFTYFVAIQRPSATADPATPPGTSLARVCQNDRTFASYVEVPLECRGRGPNGTVFKVVTAVHLAHPGSALARSLGFRTSTATPGSWSAAEQATSTDQERVLVAVFTAASSSSSASQDGSRSRSASSAMCVYPMREVKRMFTAAIQKCFRGEGLTGPDHLVQPKACFRTPLDITDDYCGQYGINHPIKGSEPVSRDAVITWPGTSVTSVAVAVTGNYTVAFAGTDRGDVRKVVIESGDSAREYGSPLHVQSGRAIKQDMLLDRSGHHLYAMTDRKVHRLKVHNCSSVSGSCSECLRVRDPYCGWCPLRRRCTTMDECTTDDGSVAGSRWQSFDVGQCTSLLTVTPQSVPKQAAATSMIALAVRNLPSAPSSGFQCRFSGSGAVYTTSVMQLERIEAANTTLKCETPIADQLPAFPLKHDHLTLVLSLVSDGYELLSTNVTFYDCTAHLSCTSCTSSHFPCSWCVQMNRCTNTKMECPSDVVVTGKRGGPGYCPHIEPDGPTPEIAVASESKVNIRVRALHLQNFHMAFKCIFDYNGGVEKHGWLIPGANNEVHIECDPLVFEVKNHSQFIDVPFNIVWGNMARKVLDNPSQVRVQVYSCSQMANNCGRCRSTQVRYNCGWCVNSKSCSVHDQCTGGSATWISRDEACPDPVVTKFEPHSGPLEGGTNVTIVGENLGLSANDTSVTVAGVDCRIIYYQSAVRLVCQTGPSDAPREGHVIVAINPSFAAKSEDPFSYVKSDATDVSPKAGPVSGGQQLTIVGNHLNAGSHMDVKLANRTFATSCQVVNRLPTSVTCLTAQSSEPFLADMVSLMVDNSQFRVANVSYRYLPDPVISSVIPEKGVYSGGTHLVVKGERLRSVLNPFIVVYAANDAVLSPCRVVDDSEMMCVSPNFQHSLLNSSQLSSSAPEFLCYGFLLDGVSSFHNLSSPVTGRHMFAVYPDPQFDEFEEGTKKFFFLRNEYLTINGKNLNLALHKDDIQVLIGGSECNVTSISSTQLTCLPSADNHSPVKNTASRVVVLVGNTTYYIGDLEFTPSVHRFLISVPFISGVAAAGGILLTLVIIICAAYHHKSRESDRVVKTLKCQMDNLEARVAKECKEAFAELQTDVTEIVGNISGPGGIPFHSYAGFCVRAFFPEGPVNEHGVLGSFEYATSPRNGMDRGLVLFNQLISNKIFLLVFIRTLELRKDFIVREKVNVASLICVILQNRLEYLTDILKTLLSELIEKSVEDHHHPRLLLRRTESVVEKMLANWFTILLHSFLKECAGEPLYMLFLAVKHQVDRGPIDMLTGDARYSLSEDKLIRQDIECRALTVIVVDADTQYSQQTYTVKVLSCDTVSQVKDKILDTIYRYVPFSLRPSSSELDLEWHTGVKDRVILQDEDVTTKSEGHYRRLNTLGYYRVPDGARMSLVPRQRSLYSINSSVSNNKSSICHKYDTLFASSLPLSRSTSSPNAFEVTAVSGNSRLYHLVKPHDMDHQKKGERNNNKMVSEIYLTRLLSTKGALQLYVDNLFETIFSTMQRGSVIPVAVKYMFDFLDDQALHHGIADPQVVHTWKSNSLPLRFWVNVIKNPDFVFDIHKSNAVDSCLSVIAQTFMDSCSVSEQKLGKESSSRKLLYAKDIPKYRKWVERYYEDIQRMPAITEQDMNSMLCDESMVHQNEFNISAALHELYQYAVKYNDDLMQSLEEDEFGRNYRLASRLSQVHAAMDSYV